MPEKNRFPAVLQPLAFSAKDNGADATVGISPTLRSQNSDKGNQNSSWSIAIVQPVCATGETNHCLTSSHRGSEDGTGRGTPIVIDRAAFNQGVNAQYEPHIEATETMDTLISKGPHAVGVAQPIAFQPGNLMRRAGSDPSTEAFPTIKCDAGDQSPHVATVTPMAVRRLTPEECEALQGFPKGYSRIPWKGKPASECPDGPRYKACGNSMAVPVMRWVGERIALVDKLISQTQPEQPKP
jgi:DNA (cytosine-5)-methyltransferase 1